MNFAIIIFVMIFFTMTPSSRAQSFPFEQLNKIKWGMSLDELKKAKPASEMKIEKGNTFYMVQDSIYGHSAAFGFALSKNEMHLIQVSIICFRERKRPNTEFEQLSNQLITLITTHHGNPVTDKKIMGQRGLKWANKGSDVLLLVISDKAVIVMYSEPK